MEAATLQKKKKSMNKGKLKKTIKNVLCRPDPIFWPKITDEQGKVIETALGKHKILIPQFKKPHWKEVKSLPKDERPKPPKLEKVNGLLFGISECCTAIKGEGCSSIIIESTVNPRTIVHPVIEACINAKVPVICLDGLRKLTASNFGIPTSCLGISINYLQDISDTIVELSKDKVPTDKDKVIEVPMLEKTKSEKIAINNQDSSSHSLYLYRGNKKHRAFVPPSDVNVNDNKRTTRTTKFIGQDFIEFPEKPAKQISKRAYSKMIVKRITSNPNRIKQK